MAGSSLESSATIRVPEPEKVVSYTSNSEQSVLFLYGDPASAKMALMCPGFPDDHTVFQPFAQALSEKGGVLVGIMCLPGYEYEDREGARHPRDGYSYDEMTHTMREAAKALRAASTHPCPELTGIFHDWGIVPGTQWASRSEEEAADSPHPSKPDKVVFFDVIFGPSPKAEDIPTDVEQLSTRELINGNLYQIILAVGFLVQRYISKPLAPLVALPPLIFLTILGLAPLYDFDTQAKEALYGDKKLGLMRLFYMCYPYWNHFKLCWSERNWGGVKALITLHRDWQATPVLYLYGKKKRTQFHHFTTLRMLEREEDEKRSLSKAVGVEEAGHYLFIQKHDECLQHVLNFIQAENTFVSS